MKNRDNISTSRESSEHEILMQSPQWIYSMYVGGDPQSAIEFPDDQCVSQLARMLYKATSCGMYVEVAERAPDGRVSALSIGSIVEGSDANTENHIMRFPEFTWGDWSATVEAIEIEADEIWNEYNAEYEAATPYEGEHPESNGPIVID